MDRRFLLSSSGHTLIRSHKVTEQSFHHHDPVAFVLGSPHHCLGVLNHLARAGEAGAFRRVESILISLQFADFSFTGYFSTQSEGEPHFPQGSISTFDCDSG